MHGRSGDTSLAEIRQETSELLDKQVNAQKESFDTSGTQAPASPRKKCVM